MDFLFVFLSGTCIGSFLNVAIERIPRNRSIIKGRSECDTCHHVLAWYDLIPLVSFFLLGRKCRYCHAPLSFQYPLIELATGILFVISYYLLGVPVDLLHALKSVLLLCLFAAFFALTLMDIKYGILSDKLVSTAAILSFFIILFSPGIVISHLVVGLVCLGILLLLFFITKGRGIGLGDVKLSFVMGILLGFPSILIAFYVAFLTGAFVAIILVIARKKKLHGGTIAFGPFLLVATYISWFFGTTLWVLLLHLLGI